MQAAGSPLFTLEGSRTEPLHHCSFTAHLHLIHLICLSPTKAEEQTPRACWYTGFTAHQVSRRAAVSALVSAGHTRLLWAGGSRNDILHVYMCSFVGKNSGLSPLRGTEWLVQHFCRHRLLKFHSPAAHNTRRVCLGYHVGGTLLSGRLSAPCAHDPRSQLLRLTQREQRRLF